MRLPRRFVIVVTSAFFAGYAPKAPGLFGSLVGFIPAWFFPHIIPAAAIVTTVIGLWLCRPAVEVYGNKDPQRFVFDEVCGQFIALIALPHDFRIFLAAFILFRIFDTLKPWPIIIFQNMKHPWGIMLDDIVAGLLTNVILRTLLWYWF